MQLVLYITDDCSFCEQAMTLLGSIGQLSGSTLLTHDIAYVDQLFNQYGEKIPVLRIGNHELIWPFTSVEVVNLVQTVASRS